MSVQQEVKKKDDVERRVAEYLRRHPEFFERHAELLGELRVPHDSGQAVSLIERQVAILREQNRCLGGQLQELIGIARENDQLGRRLHQLTIALLEAEDLSQILDTLHRTLHAEFAADLVSLCLLAAPREGEVPGFARVVDRADPALAEFTDILVRGEPVCGRLKPAQRAFLFGEMADGVASLALLPLRWRSELGLLAIGSHDEGRFHAGKGTAYLTQMAELISRILGRQLGRP